jgi:magnesium-transporting ATPase (P-type)
LVRDPAALEALARTRVFAFDKTGTLTSGKACVVGIDSGGAATNEVLARAAGLGCYSDHWFFGLCDLGMGSPELGYVSRAEIEETAYSRRPPLIERDLYFRPAYSLSVYKEEARRAGRITENPIDLSAAKGAIR